MRFRAWLTIAGVVAASAWLAMAPTALLPPVLRGRFEAVAQEAPTDVPKTLPAAATDAASQLSAQSRVDSLLPMIGLVRQLEPRAAVSVRLVERAALERLYEMQLRTAAFEGHERAQARLWTHMGLLPREVDLLRARSHLHLESNPGYYDLESRQLIMGRWLPPQAQTEVAKQELVHALQDQHFSLRVRRKLGFEEPDEALAWEALVRGDARATAMELTLAASGRSFAQSCEPGEGISPVLPAEAPGVDAHNAAGAQALHTWSDFAPSQGLCFVARLYQEGGWPRVDDAFVRPPASSEQVLHPEHYLLDLPVRIQLPDVRDLLAPEYELVADQRLGELDLAMFLSRYVDPEIARVASSGWGGCRAALYVAGTAPAVFVLSSVWDTEEDAQEFFGALIGTLGRRYPNQQGLREATTLDLVQWEVAASRVTNLLRIQERQVLCIEQAPSGAVERLVERLDREARFDDPTPGVRARDKSELAWNRTAAPRADTMLTLDLQLPPGWNAVAVDTTESGVLLAAERDGAELEVTIHRQARDPLGARGFMQAMAHKVQAKGRSVFVHPGVSVPRTDVHIRQYVFSQVEGSQHVVYYLGVADLMRGYGCILLRHPSDTRTPMLLEEFVSMLTQLRVLPLEDAAPALDVPARAEPGSRQ